MPHEVMCNRLLCFFADLLEYKVTEITEEIKNSNKI